MELKIKISFPLAFKNIKYFRVNLTKCVQDHYNENSKTLPRKIKTKISGDIYRVH